MKWTGMVLTMALVGSAAAAAADAVPLQPSLKITTLDQGEFDLEANRGKWVVVNFWATWCAPCRKEMPDLSTFDRSREDVIVIGLAFEEIDPADLREFMKKLPVVYPIAIVDTYAPPPDFATPNGLPMTYVIDPEGKVAKRFLGPVSIAELTAATSR